MPNFRKFRRYCILLGSDSSGIGSDDPTQNESATLTIPSNTSGGTYYIIFSADNDNELTESDEANNFECQQIIVTSPIGTTYVPDDNFEQRLISLGYDDVLDNYVITANITNIIYLYVSSENISDLTGVQDFSSLQTLMCEDNQIVSLNISQNSNLESLWISSNQLTSLDISQNSKLIELGCSRNKIFSLDCSNNNNLEWLECNNNSLTMLDVKNGNNIILTNFRANLNQNLSCIKVDDETEANNGVGVYVNWVVDNGVNYSENCDNYGLDTDNDDVINNVDQCPNTPTGEEVNVTGCSQSQIDDDGDSIMNNLDLCPNTTVGITVNENGCFFLPSNNFNLEVTSETCPNKNNGELIITANETHSYTATINNVNHNFNNNSLIVSNLVPDTYSVCISVAGEIFEQCYTIVIAEGTMVSGKASVTSNKASIAIEQGTAPYDVYVNDISVLNTLASSFTIDVKHGDLLEVKTAISCEGVFLKAIDLFENIIAYPNPSKGIFEITLPISEKEVVIELYTIGSQLISKETYKVLNGKVKINLENKPIGVYVVKIQLDTPVNLTIIKE